MSPRFPHPMGALSDPAPACWRWKPITAVNVWRLIEPHTPETWTAMSALNQQWTLLLNWHRCRCAICGTTRGVGVEDHDHATGLTRGILCRSCNSREGCGWEGAYEKYRQRNPASILGFSLPYIDPVTGYAVAPMRRS